MGEWMYNRNGKAVLIQDSDCLRSNHGQVVAWISGNNVFSINGRHCGWFEDGVLFDSCNCVLGFLSAATGQLPSRPGIGSTPGTPGFAGRPGRPGFSGIPGRPGRGGWYTNNLEAYF